MDALEGIIRESLLTTAVLCLPILALATAVGTVVALVQAATQVQEQTLVLLPKMIAVGAAVAALGSFAMGLCATLFTDAIAALPRIAYGG